MIRPPFWLIILIPIIVTIIPTRIVVVIVIITVAISVIFVEIIVILSVFISDLQILDEFHLISRPLVQKVTAQIQIKKPSPIVSNIDGGR
jgi:hypothetical protein